MVKGIGVEGNTSALNLLPEGNKIQTKSTDNDNNKNNNLNMLNKISVQFYLYISNVCSLFFANYI